MSASPDLYAQYTSTSALASGYAQDEALAWAKGHFRAHYATVLPAARDAAILEIGCGYGSNLSALSDMGYVQSHGIDLSAEQIAHARRVLGLSNVEEADALEWLDDKQGRYDCILALDVLEHLDTDTLIRLGTKIRSALKPGGRLIVQVPNGLTPISPYRYGDLTHVRAFTPQSMQQFFLLVGLEPNGYFELPTHVHGLRSVIRRALWIGVVKPIISGMMRVMQGRVFGGDIYTPNFFAVARRP